MVVTNHFMFQGLNVKTLMAPRGIAREKEREGILDLLVASILISCLTLHVRTCYAGNLYKRVLL